MIFKVCCDSKLDLNKTKQQVSLLHFSLLRLSKTLKNLMFFYTIKFLKIFHHLSYVTNGCVSAVIKADF